MTSHKQETRESMTPGLIRRITLWKAVWMAGLLGAVGPLAFALAAPLMADPIHARRYRWLWDMLEWLAPIIWPTQLLMLVTHRREHTVFGYSIFAISLVSNIIVFVLAGTVCWVAIKTLLRAALGRR
jgi:hypothetical protein